MEPCRYYPKFEPNQVLTADQLNQAVSYLETHERLTRTLLIGVGPLCGLRVTKSGTLLPKITISRGVGVTTHGYLMKMEKQEYTRYRNYTDPVRYDYFWNNDTQIELWELLPAVIEEEEEGIFPLNDTILQNKAVVLYLEIRNVDLETCTGDDCDEKGIRVELCIKPLLVKFSDLDKMLKQAHGYGDNADLKSLINARFHLPEVSIRKPDALAGFGEVVYYPQIHEAYREVIEKALPDVKKALSAVYERYKPLLQPTFPSDAIDTAILDEWFEKFLESRSPGIQYFYDFLKDLILGYNEFTSTAFDVLTACVPEKTWFPVHLMLGPAIPPEECEPSIYRHRFIASPLHEHPEVKSEAVLSLYRRLAKMVKGFAIPDPGESQIRVTPSREDGTPLSVRSVPYYYHVAGETGLHMYWNHELRRQCRSDRNLSYHGEVYQDETTPHFARSPLLYNTDHYPFFRIEGHIGHSYKGALSTLQQIIQSRNLPVNLQGLKLGEFLPESGSDSDCRFEHLEVVYNGIKGDLKCWLDREIAFFSRLEYGEATPDEQEGITGIRGRVINQAGEPVPGARIYLSSGKVIATSAKDGTFGPVQLSPTNYELIIHHADYRIRRRQIKLTENKLMSLEIQLNAKDGFSVGDVGYMAVGEFRETARYEQPEEVSRFFATRRLDFTSQPEKGEDVKTISVAETKLPEYQIGEYFEESISGATYEYTVGDLYQNYALSAEKQDLLSYTYNTLIADPVLDIVDITDIVVVNVYYPLQIINNMEAVLATFTSNLHQFDIAEFRTRYDTLVATAENYLEQLQKKKPVEPGEPSPELIAEIVRHLNEIINSCHKGKFQSLYKQFQERINEIRRLRLFGPYLKKHPGMEHQAGVPRGGTFYLVYDDQQQVVADFMLPYICCSDCPPVALCETTPVVFKLPKDTYCTGDETEYRFILSPPGGTVTGPGVTRDDSTGDYYFSPASDEVEGETVGFKYRVNDQVYLLQVGIIDLTATLTYTVESLDSENQRATVRFGAKPMDAESFHWDFGDGNTSDHQNPSHTYDLSETSEFQVKLTVQQGDCEDTAETVITFDVCSAEFTYEILEQNAEQAVVQFTSAMEDADEYQWNFGDGSDGSSESNPQHTYQIRQSQEFEIRLRVKKGECEDEQSRNMFIHRCNPDMKFTVIEQTPASATVAFEALMDDAETYRWDFGDGSEAEDRFEQKPVHTYLLEDGQLTFTVALEVTRGICKAQSEESLEFEPCDAAFSFEIIEQGAETARVKFTPEDPEADHYQWKFGDGSDGSEEIAPVHTFPIDDQRSFTVTLNVTKGTCSASDTATVSFEQCSAVFGYEILEREANTATVQFTPEMPDADAYNWDFGNGQTSERTNPVVMFDHSEQSTFNVSLQVTKGHCTDQRTHTVTFEPCDADFGYEIIEQSPQMVQVRFQPVMEDANSYIWDFGDGSSKSSARAPRHSFNIVESQAFTVTLQIKKDTCEDTHEETIEFETCSADFVYEILERGEEEILVQFTASMDDAETYQWNFGDGSDPVAEANPQHVFKITGQSSFTVRLQVQKGSCKDSQEQILLVRRCTAEFTHEVIEWNSRQAQVRFTPTMEDAETYRWDFGDQSEASKEPIPTHTYDIREQNIFKVTLTVTAPDCEDQRSQRIVINVVL